MANFQPEVRNILRSISIKYNLPLVTIEEIWTSQFKFAAEKIATGEYGNYESFENVYLPNFGNFVASKKKIENITERVNNKKLLEDGEGTRE